MMGNILVIKTDSMGYVHDVLERELYFIERLVYRHVASLSFINQASYNCTYSFMEEGWREKEFPELTNPLLLPVRDDVWESW